ncbi:hypothetical protein GX48_00135 [Paracoccidioides brasiliensis]|nr:hypothetical protein GX48_00135 [Paracoccidioides brasiliensis]
MDHQGKYKNPQSKRRFPMFLSAPSQLRRQYRGNQLRNRQVFLRMSLTEGSHNRQRRFDGANSSAAPRTFPPVNHHLLRVYKSLLRRNRIVTQELNTLKQHLETLQPSRSLHEIMDWEPIPPADTHHQQQQQQQQGQQWWRILDMPNSAS